MTTRHDIPEFTALRSYLDGSSPEYRDLDIEEVIRKSKYGHHVYQELLNDALAFQTSKNQKEKRDRQLFRATVKPLLTQIIFEGHPDGKELSPHFVLRHAYDLLCSVSPEDDEIKSEIIAWEILEAEVLPMPLPPFGTFEGWFRGWKLDQMTDCPESGSGT